MNEFHFATWEDCEAQIRSIEEQNRSLAGVCFRGHANADWPLKTTLERRTTTVSSFIDYYNLMQRIKPAIETFTNYTWELPNNSKIEEWAKSYDARTNPNQTVLAYSYMAHLRHNGFPSPLLDWTRSPYVAAFFAFSKPQSNEVAIYAFADSPNNSKEKSSREPRIDLLGEYVRTHKRHFRQQSIYTISSKYSVENGWEFAPHDEVFDLARPAQDLGWKLVVPASERTKVLTILRRVNITEFSLFDSEESLMEAMAVQEIDLRTEDR